MCIFKLIYSQHIDNIIRFLDLNKLVPNLEQIHAVFNNFNSDQFKTFLKIRYKEVKEFEAYNVSMKAFIQYCKKFPQINVSAYSKQLDELEGLDIENMHLNSVCKKLNFGPIDRK